VGPRDRTFEALTVGALLFCTSCDGVFSVHVTAPDGGETWYYMPAHK
jgi:hypothetical protein